ncbi:MAG TPA: amidohydrolase family protein [Planctomycetaceae bacterium]|jgi:N-acetylglucosamine-6-phosphate deacetylase
MSTLSFEARRYDTGEPVRVHISGGTIAAIEPAWLDSAIPDCPFVAPGLFDLQINGYGGVWFSDRLLTPDKVLAAITPYFAHGVTRLCPTLITTSHETFAAGFAAIRRACEQHPWLDHVVAGCHQEGPYLSGEDGPRGAHPREHIRAADWDEFCVFQKASGNRIRLVTIAPEVPHAIEFIRRAVETGVRIAIGHTAASTEQIHAAVEAGATLSTHLGNGAHAILRRHPNYIWDQLGESRLSASIITDGLHLPPSVVRSIVRAKSIQQTIVTCDASGWAGSAPGVYENELGKVEVLADGRIVPAGQRDLLAGSGAATDACVAYAANCGAVTLREAIDMTTRNPARFFGMPEQGLRAGATADLFLYRLVPSADRLDVVATLVAGQVRFGKIV